MRNRLRLLYYLLINILVSACTILSILFLWERKHKSSSVITPVSLPPATVVASAPTEAPTPVSPTQALVVYQVEQGDTLGSIAQAFGVDVEQLMALNGLSDPHTLAVGQAIFIPASPTEVSMPEVIPTSTLPPSPSAAVVEIANVIGVQDLEQERVVIKRLSSDEGELSLENWRLMDEDGNQYFFPSLVLYPGGAVSVYTGMGVDTVVELYWGLQEPVYQPGEVITLLDSEGNLQASFRIP
jgi:LysM repeat protein